MKHMKVRTALVRAGGWGAHLVRCQLRAAAPGRPRVRALLIFRRSARPVFAVSRSAFLRPHVQVHHHWNLMFNLPNVWRDAVERAITLLQHSHTSSAVVPAGMGSHDLAPQLRGAVLRWRVAVGRVQSPAMLHGTTVPQGIRSSRRDVPRRIRVTNTVADLAAPRQVRLLQGAGRVHATPEAARGLRPVQQVSGTEVRAASCTTLRQLEQRSCTQAVMRLLIRDRSQPMRDSRFASPELATSMASSSAADAARVLLRVRRRRPHERFVPREVAPSMPGAPAAGVGRMQHRRLGGRFVSLAAAPSTVSTPAPEVRRAQRHARVGIAASGTVKERDAAPTTERGTVSVGRIVPRAAIARPAHAPRDLEISPAVAAVRLVQAASMVWRKNFESAVSPSAPGMASESRQGKDRGSLGAVEASHGHALAAASATHVTSHHVSTQPRGDGTATAARTALSGEQVERLTDDVMRRIERRLREDRERRGR